MARDGRHVCAPVRGAVLADAANTHGKRREGDEGDQDEQQRLTETRDARGQKNEVDIWEESNGAQGRSLFGQWNGSPEKKTKGDKR